MQSILALGKIQCQFIPSLASPVVWSCRLQRLDEILGSLHTLRRSDGALTLRVKIGPAIRPKLGGISRIHGMPHIHPSLAKTAYGPIGIPGNPVRSRKIGIPRCRHLHRAALQDFGNIGQIVRFTVYWNLQQRSRAQRLAEAPGPTVRPNQGRQKIFEMIAVSGILNVIAVTITGGMSR